MVEILKKQDKTLITKQEKKLSEDIMFNHLMDDIGYDRTQDTIINTSTSIFPDLPNLAFTIECNKKIDFRPLANFLMQVLFIGTVFYTLKYLPL
jgi:hypothetical protein